MAGLSPLSSLWDRWMDSSSHSWTLSPMGDVTEETECLRKIPRT